MANVDFPSGFRVARHLTGGMPNRATRYAIEPALASNVFKGDAVVPTATTKRITRPSADTDRLQGVFQGCAYLRPDGEPVYDQYWPTGQTVLTGSTPDAWVYDDPSLIFEVQYDGTFALADIGSLADLVRGTGNTATGISADEIDSAGSGQVFKIHDYVRRPDNAVGAASKLLVSIMKHYLGASMTAI